MDDHNSNIEFAELFSMLQKMTKNQQKIEPHQLSKVDQLVNSQEMRILKATLPYFEYEQQKKLAMVLKILEFRKTMEVFNSPIEIHNEVLPKKEINKLDILNDIRKACDENNQKKINNLIMLMNLQSSWEGFKTNQKLISSDVSDMEGANNKAPNEDGYIQFMNMMNKIIKEKEGE